MDFLEVDDVIAGPSTSPGNAAAKEKLEHAKNKANEAERMLEREQMRAKIRENHKMNGAKIDKSEPCTSVDLEAPSTSKKRQANSPLRDPPPTTKSKRTMAQKSGKHQRPGKFINLLWYGTPINVLYLWTYYFHTL